MDSLSSGDESAHYRALRCVKEVVSLDSRYGLKHALTRAAPGPVPDQLQKFHHASPEEKKRRALRVLLLGRVNFRNRVDADLESCLSDGSLESWWAKEFLRAELGERNLSLWSLRTRRADVYRVLDRVIRRCRAKPGGWFVSPRKAEAA